MTSSVAKITDEEIVASISVGLGVKVLGLWPVCANGFPELHRQFSATLMITIENLIGRLEDTIEAKGPMFEMQMESQHFYLWPVDTSDRLIRSKSILQRIDRYLTLGFKDNPTLMAWFELGSAIGMFIAQSTNEAQERLLIKYRELFDREEEPRHYLSIVSKRNLGWRSKISATEEKEAFACARSIVRIERELEKTLSGVLIEDRVLRLMRQKFQVLEKYEVLVIRSLTYLEGTWQGKGCSATQILKVIQKRFLDQIPDSWKKARGAQVVTNFKTILSNMVKRGILSMGPENRGYLLTR